MGLVLPILGGVIGLTVRRLAGPGTGDLAALAFLAGSATYIATPAAMGLALPKADEGIHLTLSLDVTFPFNLALGIPLNSLAPVC